MRLAGLRWGLGLGFWSEADEGLGLILPIGEHALGEAAGGAAGVEFEQLAEGFLCVEVE